MLIHECRIPRNKTNSKNKIAKIIIKQLNIGKVCNLSLSLLTIFDLQTRVSMPKYIKTLDF